VTRDVHGIEAEIMTVLRVEIQRAWVRNAGAADEFADASALLLHTRSSRTMPRCRNARQTDGPMRGEQLPPALRRKSATESLMIVPR